tara:strand:+ start:4794 stop:5414 length:621 start_codon:yes stop_codon:yes gene_type:complete
MSEIKWHKKVKNSAEQQHMKRDALLDVAADSFVVYGYRGTSLDQIAKTLNVTKAALYYYVKNKEDIFFQCISISMRKVIECAENAQYNGENGLDKLIFFFQEYAELSVNRYGSSLILEGERSLNSQNKAVIRTKKLEAQKYLVNIIDEGIADGSIKNCNTKYVAVLLFSAFNLMHQWYRPDGGMSPRDLANEILKPVITGLKTIQE